MSRGQRGRGPGGCSPHRRPHPSLPGPRALLDLPGDTSEHASISGPAAAPRPQPHPRWGSRCTLTSSPGGPVLPGLPGSPSAPGSPWTDEKGSATPVPSWGPSALRGRPCGSRLGSGRTGKRLAGTPHAVGNWGAEPSLHLSQNLLLRREAPASPAPTQDHPQDHRPAFPPTGHLGVPARSWLFILGVPCWLHPRPGRQRPDLCAARGLALRLPSEPAPEAGH